jgi:hypothetical protein
MIGDILEIIAKDVSQYIDSQLEFPSGKKSVTLSKPTNSSGELLIPDNTISLSLLNIEQEMTSRDSLIQKRVIDGKVYSQNPAVDIHLSVIFIANFQKDYISELNYITKIIEFFQQKGTFTKANTPQISEKNLPIDKLTCKLSASRLEEQNSIWSLLGMKYMPSVVYKISTIRIQDPEKETDESIARSIRISANKK